MDLKNHIGIHIIAIIGQGNHGFNFKGRDPRSNQFHMNIYSACIQYPGFCQDYNVGPLTDAVGEEVEWDDDDYLPKELVERIKNRKTDINNPMKVGWKLEAVDLMDPKLICPATVKVRFRFISSKQFFWMFSRTFWN